MLTLRKRSPTNIYRKARPEIYHTIDEGGVFEITSHPDSSCLTLENQKFFLIRPHKPLLIPTGVRFVKTNCYGIIIYGLTKKKTVVCHAGLIDPNFTGVVCIIAFNLTDRNTILLPGELKVKFCAINFFSPTLLTPSYLCSPQYFGDAGYDVRCSAQLILFPHNEVEITLPVKNPLKNDHYIPIVMGRSGLARQGLYVKPTAWKRGLAKLYIRNLSAITKVIKKGDRICQMVFIRKDQLKNQLYFLCHDKIGNILIKGADVSFVNADEDMYRSLVSLQPRIQPIKSAAPARITAPGCHFQGGIYTTPHYQPHIPTRGNQGFGSSGI